MAPSLTLHYFQLPGRAEAARLCLHISGTPFEDHRISFEEWPSLKDSFPFRMVPVLEVDGEMLPQMAVIDRYVAGLTGLTPKGASSLEVAQAEALYAFAEDVWEPIKEAFQVQMSDSASDEERAAAAAKLIAPDGSFMQRLALWDAALAARLQAASGDGNTTTSSDSPGYVVGPSLSYLDLGIFAYLCMMRSGWVKAIPRTFLAPFPTLRAFRHRIASEPRVREWYAQEAQQDEWRTRGYGPDDDDDDSAVAAAAPASG